MSQAIEFTGLVTDGKLPEATAKRIGQTIRAFNGKSVFISIKEVKRRRSRNQNAYYFGVVIPPILAEFREAGNAVDSEDVHSYLKQHVGKLKRKIVTPDGEILEAVASTAGLTTMEMEAYLERVRAWAVEVLGIAIGLPNETL